MQPLAHWLYLEEMALVGNDDLEVALCQRILQLGGQVVRDHVDDTVDWWRPIGRVREVSYGALSAE